MFGQVEEWMQVPGSPNLFWALTDLPAPLVNPAPAMRTELTTLYRSFPPLREVLAPVRQGGVERGGDQPDRRRTDQGLGGVRRPGNARLAEETRRRRPRLQDLSRCEKVPAKNTAAPTSRLDAMPAAQVVLLYFVEQYDEIKDDFLKWMNVPPWQARAGLDGGGQGDSRFHGAGHRQPDHRRLLLPAVEKVYERPRPHRAHGRLPALRRALRLYAATHDGKPPEKLEDVKLPLPVDPYTGESFGKFYKVRQGRHGRLRRFRRRRRTRRRRWAAGSCWRRPSDLSL